MKGKGKFLWFALLGLALYMAGCGGGGGGGGVPPPQVSTTAVQVKVGDAAADMVIEFRTTINTVTLHNANGSTFTALSAPVTIELTHLAGTFEPLKLINVPQGTYDSATVTAGTSELTFVDPNTHQVQHQNFAAPGAPLVIALNPNITVGSTPTILNIDFNLGTALTFNSNTGLFSFDPTKITATATTPAAGNQEPENGAAEDVNGTVTSVSGSLPGGSFTISTATGSLTFSTDNSTVFAPSAASVTPNTIVEVDAVTKSDGSLLAKKVDAEVEDGTAGLDAEGMVTTRTPAVPNSVTSFTIVVREESSPGTTMPGLGSTLTVNVNGNTQFKVDLDNVPGGFSFGATSLNVAQGVEADTDTPNASTITAKQVMLKKQALSGGVSTFTGTPGTFTLTMASTSAFASLAGTTTVTVTTTSATVIKGTLSGSTVSARVRGFLFFDTVSSSYKMLATRIDNIQ